MNVISRRSALLGVLGVAGGGLLTACGSKSSGSTGAANTSAPVSSTDPASGSTATGDTTSAATNDTASDAATPADPVPSQGVVIVPKYGDKFRLGMIDGWTYQGHYTQTNGKGAFFVVDPDRMFEGQRPNSNDEYVKDLVQELSVTLFDSTNKIGTRPSKPPYVSPASPRGDHEGFHGRFRFSDVPLTSGKTGYVVGDVAFMSANAYVACWGWSADESDVDGISRASMQTVWNYCDDNFEPDN